MFALSENFPVRRSKTIPEHYIIIKSLFNDKQLHLFEIICTAGFANRRDKCFGKLLVAAAALMVQLSLER